MNRYIPAIVLLTIIACCSALLIQGRPEESSDTELRSLSDSLQESAVETGDPELKYSVQPERATSIPEMPEHSAAEAPVERTRTDILVRVTGLTPGTGKLRVAVFESPEGFPKSDQSTSTTVIEADGTQAEFSLALPVNRPFAIAVFQDLDGNEVMNRNRLGIPTEPYGFSNEARGLLGPPKFQQAVVRIMEGQAALEIKVR